MANQLKKLPSSIREYIVKQKIYSQQDHEVWRYILNISEEFLNKNAHPAYKKSKDLLKLLY